MASGISTPKKIAADIGQNERAIKIPKNKPPNIPYFENIRRKCSEILNVYCLGNRIPKSIMPTMIRMGPKSCLIYTCKKLAAIGILSMPNEIKIPNTANVIISPKTKSKAVNILLLEFCFQL